MLMINLEIYKRNLIGSLRVSPIGDNMKKLKNKAKIRKLQAKRARKAAKRKKIRKEKMKHHNQVMDLVRSMDDEELKEFLGVDDLDELDD